MSYKLGIDELNAMIANVIREKNLNNVFGDESLEMIREKVLKNLNTEKNNNIEENEEIKNQMEPDKKEAQNVSQQQPQIQPQTQPQPQISSQQEKEQHVVELPEFINKIEPWKMIIFNENELSHGAENLSKVAYRLMNNPDEKSTMKDMWLKEGKRKSEVYIAKFEKIGEIEYNHMDGTSKFSNLSKIDVEKQSEYSNPYQDKESVQTVNDKEVETYIKNALDLESIVEKKVEDILAKYFTSEKYQSDKKSQEVQQNNTSYDNLDMNKIASGNEFMKVSTPMAIQESVNGNLLNGVSLVVEGSDFRVFDFEGREFVLAKNPISTKKCYTKI